MSVIGLFAVECDRCGAQGPAATDMVSARTASTGAGWALVRDAVQTYDYCPEHADRTTRPAVVEPAVAATTWECSECSAGRPDLCGGWAWDLDRDERVECGTTGANR